jgi:hypothetical protein
LGSPGGPSPRALVIRAKCDRCGEVLQARINLANDLSAEFDESGKKTGYTCRKVLMGSGRCFQQVEILLHFDPNRSVQSRDIRGGTFADEPGSSSDG